MCQALFLSLGGNGSEQNKDPALMELTFYLKETDDKGTNNSY